MEHLFIAALGGLVNRIRGGLWGSFLPDADMINAVVFGLAIALVPSAEYMGMVDEVPHYDFINPDWTAGFYAALAMFAGAVIGWGKYIGALGGWEFTNLVEWPPIDKFITRYQSKPKLWGFLGLTLRGGVWGFLITLVLHSLFPLIGGLLMGVVYWIALKIGGRSFGWPLGEILFGVVFWFFCFI